MVAGRKKQRNHGGEYCPAWKAKAGLRRINNRRDAGGIRGISIDVIN
jgi:hypothetical protein